MNEVICVKCNSRLKFEESVFIKSQESGFTELVCKDCAKEPRQEGEHWEHG